MAADPIEVEWLGRWSTLARRAAGGALAGFPLPQLQASNRPGLEEPGTPGASGARFLERQHEISYRMTDA